MYLRPEPERKEEAMRKLPGWCRLLGFALFSALALVPVEQLVSISVLPWYVRQVFLP